ncbi:MAG: N-formylglutamate amidohydrolase [Acidobacteria bacterium]|nr:N-formylglutamate amidohydrolase [Acidobacteriota bacterium]
MRILNTTWRIKEGKGWIAAAAIHNGHYMRPDLKKLSALTPEERLREEDPFTGYFTNIADSRIVVNCSRFEADLNRPPEKAVYLLPDDAWGLNLWKSKPNEKQISQSMEYYNNFYKTIGAIIEKKIKEHGRFCLLDIHSYNHQREGKGIEADPEENPEINLGTGTLPERWRKAADNFAEGIKEFSYFERSLDVRENIKFKGGHLSKWIHENYSDYGFAVAIEIKKIFMDEWTGKPDTRKMKAIREALSNGVRKLEAGI